MACAMNVAIVKRTTNEVVARYEIHKAGDGAPPPDEEYFDEAWQRAISERLVDAKQRRSYDFQLQLPKTIYEASR
jgi:hypothetical protein